VPGKKPGKWPGDFLTTPSARHRQALIATRCQVHCASCCSTSSQLLQRHNSPEQTVALRSSAAATSWQLASCASAAGALHPLPPISLLRNVSHACQNFVQCFRPCDFHLLEQIFKCTNTCMLCKLATDMQQLNCVKWQQSLQLQDSKSACLKTQMINGSLLSDCKKTSNWSNCICLQKTEHKLANWTVMTRSQLLHVMCCCVQLDWFCLLV